jgi:hypothetical protein
VQTILDSDAVIWLGDFNYRVDMDRDEVVGKVKGDELPALLEADQCRREMIAGRAFVGLQEAAISFPPTYKFDKNTTNPYGKKISDSHRTFLSSLCRIFKRFVLSFLATDEMCMGCQKAIFRNGR